MILSASRRTDIPCFYGEWFFNRLKAGFFDVRNPMNARRISRIPVSPDTVECIVFWTKNPIPMIRRLTEFKEYPWYMQFTLTPYGREIEPGLPDKKELIRAFRELSGQAGREHLVWRYDPILLTPDYDIPFLMRRFHEMAGQLAEDTDTVVISFLDRYVKNAKRLAEYGIRIPEEGEMREMAAEMAETASKYGLRIEACAELADFGAEGIVRGHCIDPNRIERITGFRIKSNKDRNQRPECGCMESVDIGSYDTCRNGCRYCYASRSEAVIRRKYENYDAASSLLCEKTAGNGRNGQPVSDAGILGSSPAGGTQRAGGEGEPEENITIREVKILRE